MLLEIDDACLKEARAISLTLDTMDLEGLNIQGRKPMLDELQKMDKKSKEYKELVEILTSGLVEDFDSYINGQILQKRDKFTLKIS